MTWQRNTLVMIVSFMAASCDWKVPQSNEGMVDSLSVSDSLNAQIDIQIAKAGEHKIDNAQNRDTSMLPPLQKIDVKKVQSSELVTFAETLIGIPYVYGSTNPKVGFDCSGFITYVFNQCGISVPRSSIDFTNFGKTIEIEDAKRGDIILFTGTNPQERHVGHMGLIVSNDDTLNFIHSTSGKAKGVTITSFSEYYQSRFVKVIRIFPK